MYKKTDKDQVIKKENAWEVLGYHFFLIERDRRQYYVR